MATTQHQTERKMGKDDWVTAVLAAAIVVTCIGLCYVVASYITGVWYG